MEICVCPAIVLSYADVEKKGLNTLSNSPELKTRASSSLEYFFEIGVLPCFELESLVGFLCPQEAKKVADIRHAKLKLAHIQNFLFHRFLLYKKFKIIRFGERVSDIF